MGTKVSHEFVCEECGNIVEVEVNFGQAPPKVTCAECQAQMHKNYGAAGVSIPAHMKAVSAYGDSETFSLAKQAITKKSRRRSFQF